LEKDSAWRRKNARAEKARAAEEGKAAGLLQAYFPLDGELLLGSRNYQLR
jgi:hypothetical protein